MREMGDGNPSYAFQSYTHPTRKKCLIRPYSGQIQFNKCLLKLYYFRRLSIQNIIGRLPSHKYLDFSRDPQENEKELNWGEKHCLFLAKCRLPSSLWFAALSNIWKQTSSPVSKLIKINRIMVCLKMRLPGREVCLRGLFRGSVSWYVSGVCFGGLFRTVLLPRTVEFKASVSGSVRRSVSGYVSRVCFAKVELPSLT